MPPTPTNTPATTVVKTWRELADRMGLTAPRVTQLKAHAEWRWTLPLSLADVQDVIRWHERTFPTDGSKNFRDEKLKREIRKLDLEIERIEGALYDADEVESAWTREGNLIRQAFQNFPSQILPELLQLGLPQPSAQAAQQRITDIVNEILRRVSQPLPR